MLSEKRSPGMKSGGPRCLMRGEKKAEEKGQGEKQEAVLTEAPRSKLQEAPRSQLYKLHEESDAGWRVRSHLTVWSHL